VSARRSRVRRLALPSVCLALGLARGAGAQSGTELGAHGVASFATSDFLGGGGYGAVRLGGQVRVALTLAAGAAEHAAAFRGELLTHFLLAPRQTHGVGVYGLGGVALVDGSDASGARDAHGYMVLGLGVESRPGAASGWALEAGVGGGFRAAVGYRWRRLRPP
jgi:hypothetical protein